MADHPRNRKKSKTYAVAQCSYSSKQELSEQALFVDFRVGGGGFILFNRGSN